MHSSTNHISCFLFMYYFIYCDCLFCSHLAFPDVMKTSFVSSKYCSNKFVNLSCPISLAFNFKCSAWLDPPGTKVPTGIASRILRACKPPHHMKAQHLGKTCISGRKSTSAEKTYSVSESLRVTPKLQFLYCLLGNKTSVISHTSIKINRKTARITKSISGSNYHLPTVEG